MRSLLLGDGEPLFRLSSEDGRGRAVMISSNVLAGIATTLSGGVFYTGFLLMYGINIVNVGIISLIPNISALFCLFSGALFSRFRRRKIPLAVARAGYHTLSILGITLVPELISDPGGRLAAFIVLMFASHALNALTTPCYSAWHVRFIPESVRARYLSVNQILTNVTALSVALVCSLVADSLSGTAAEQTVIVGVRYLAFFIACLDVAALLIPKECDWSQEKSMRNPFAGIFRVLHHRKFALTMLVVFVYNVASGLTASGLNYYLLDQAKVGYSYISIINIVYLVFLAVLSGFWQRILARRAWFTVFSVCTVLLGLTYFPYSFVNASNFLWLMTAVRLVQHFIGVGHNVTVANLPFVNIPDDDRTAAMSLYPLVANTSSLLGQALGTAYISVTQHDPATLLNVSYGSVQQLMALTGFFYVIIGFTCFLFQRTLSPESDYPKLRPIIRT